MFWILTILICVTSSEKLCNVTPKAGKLLKPLPSVKNGANFLSNHFIESSDECHRGCCDSTRCDTSLHTGSKTDNQGDNCFYFDCEDHCIFAPLSNATEDFSVSTVSREAPHEDLPDFSGIFTSPGPKGDKPTNSEQESENKTTSSTVAAAEEKPEVPPKSQTASATVKPEVAAKNQTATEAVKPEVPAKSQTPTDAVKPDAPAKTQTASATVNPVVAAKDETAAKSQTAPATVKPEVAAKNQTATEIVKPEVPTKNQTASTEIVKPEAPAKNEVETATAASASNNGDATVMDHAAKPDPSKTDTTKDKADSVAVPQQTSDTKITDTKVIDTKVTDTKVTEEPPPKPMLPKEVPAVKVQDTHAKVAVEDTKDTEKTKTKELSKAVVDGPKELNMSNTSLSNTPGVQVVVDLEEEPRGGEGRYTKKDVVFWVAVVGGSALIVFGLVTIVRVYRNRRKRLYSSLTDDYLINGMYSI